MLSLSQWQRNSTSQTDMACVKFLGTEPGLLGHQDRFWVKLGAALAARNQRAYCSRPSSSVHDVVRLRSAEYPRFPSGTYSLALLPHPRRQSQSTSSLWFERYIPCDSTLGPFVRPAGLAGAPPVLTRQVLRTLLFALFFGSAHF